MFRDLIDKLPGALDGVMRFFGWTDATSETSHMLRRMIAAEVMGYAVGLGRRTGFTLDELTNMVTDAWGKLDPKDAKSS